MARLLKNLKRPNVLYVLTFLVMLGCLSFFSLGNLILTYKNGEQINNEVIGDDHLESALTGSIFGKSELLNLNGAFRLLLGQDEMNGVVRLDNGYLAEIGDEAQPDVLEANVQSLVDLQNKLKDRNIPFLYVLTPYKIEKNNPQLPEYFQDYTNASMDSFVSGLKSNHVDVLDLRESFSSANVDHYSLFYRTDHHWNIYGGFFAFTQITEQLSDRLNVEVDPALLSLDSYTVKSYPQWHLGSYGQRTGEVFAGGADDFDILVPRFETTIIDEDTGESGTFWDIMIDDSCLQVRDYSSRYTYDTALALGNYRSEGTGCGKKILLLCDSMGKAVERYLTLAFGEVRIIDAYDPLQLNENMLEKYQPDVVVVLHFPTQIYEKGMYQFGL